VVHEPEGLSFLRVPDPIDLPSMAADEAVPDPLPAAVSHPDLGAATIPPADLLITWLETRG